MADPSQVNVSAQPKAQFTPGPPKAGPIRSKARYRASVACDPCRSKHVKCGGALPVCERCQADNKTCTYSPSLRGIRDPKKRSMVKDGATSPDQVSTAESTPSPNFSGFDIPLQLTSPRPGGWVRPETRTPAKYFFDLYYQCFHQTHSWLPPKETLRPLVEGNPETFGFLMTMILYIGSMFDENVDSTSLRNKAYKMASDPSLPVTVWSVQALLCICIAAFGEGHVKNCEAWFGKTVEMALQLGLQHKSFADGAESPVLAESYRRTYWGLYTHGSLRTVREHLGHYQLYSTLATTELPCEEWEYQTGNIPTPVTFEEYRNKSLRDYSSWAHLVGLTRICGERVVPLLNVGNRANPEVADNADDQIITWLIDLPHWKKEFVRHDGSVDLVFYHALGIAFGLRIRIQLHLNGAGVAFGVRELAKRSSSIFRTTDNVTLPPSVAAEPVSQLLGSRAFHVALELTALFKAQLPPHKLSPSCIMGLERAVLPLVDEFLFGNRTQILKDKILLLEAVLRGAGKIWPMAKAMSEDIAAVVKDAEGGGWGSPEQLQETGETTDLSILPIAGEQDDFRWATQIQMGHWPGLPSPPVKADAEDIGAWTPGMPFPSAREDEIEAWLGMPSQLVKAGEMEAEAGIEGDPSLALQRLEMGENT